MLCFARCRRFEDSSLVGALLLLFSRSSFCEFRVFGFRFRVWGETLNPKPLESGVMFFG